MKKILLILSCLIFLPGFTSCQTKCEDTVVKVPVDVTQTVDKPMRPSLSSSSLNDSSTQDDVVKAAISDVKSLRDYSEKLERLLK